MVKGLSMSIVRNNRAMKGLSIPIFRSNSFGERSIVPNNTFDQTYIDTYRQKQDVSSRSPNSI